MDIDFSKGIEYWVDLFRQLFTVIANFFKAIGFPIFAEPEEPAPEESSNNV